MGKRFLAYFVYVACFEHQRVERNKLHEILKKINYLKPTFFNVFFYKIMMSFNIVDHHKIDGSTVK